MQNSIKKVLVIFPMLFLLCMSFIGTVAKAEDKTNQTSTVQSNSQNQEGSKTIAGSSNSNESNTTVTSGTNTQVSHSAQGSTSNSNNVGPNNSQNSSEAKDMIAPVWKNINGKLYYMTKDGVYSKSGWFKEKDINPSANNDNEYYLDNTYAANIGWAKIDNSWYYFNGYGVKQTGWVEVNANFYYLDKNGIMQTGWLQDRGNKYYLNDQGAMLVGKQLIDNKWYYFGQDGSLQKGFYYSNGKLYYSTNDGEMLANDWINNINSKYYVKADSSIATGYAIINNQGENFDSTGRYLGTSQMKEHVFVRHLNVGDADCAFIKLPSGETVLIDTGTEASAEKLVNFLKEQNLKEDGGKGIIDYVIITHGHSDHIGGLASVLNNFKVKTVYLPDVARMKDWYSNVKETSENASSLKMMKDEYEVFKRAEKAMNDKNMKFINPQKGEFIDSNKILQFVQSDKDFGGIGSDKVAQYYWGINENSAIVYLNYGDLKELFTGDMEWNSEADFWTNDLLTGKKVTLLKVPHHGNDTSSTVDFLKYLQAPVGIISRGKDSVSKNTAYKNLVSNGVSIYETSSSEDGISIYATPENWTLEQKQDK